MPGLTYPAHTDHQHACRSKISERGIAEQQRCALQPRGRRTGARCAGYGSRRQQFGLSDQRHSQWAAGCGDRPCPAPFDESLQLLDLQTVADALSARKLLLEPRCCRTCVDTASCLWLWLWLWRNRRPPVNDMRIPSRVYGGASLQPGCTCPHAIRILITRRNTVRAPRERLRGERETMCRYSGSV